jgi:hypothetical protein
MLILVAILDPVSIERHYYDTTHGNRDPRMERLVAKNLISHIVASWLLNREKASKYCLPIASQYGFWAGGHGCAVRCFLTFSCYNRNCH